MLKSFKYSRSHTSLSVSVSSSTLISTKKAFEDFIESASAMYLGGIGALVIGYLIVAFHNTWTKDLSVIITIVGWIALIKGVLILVRPNLMIGLTKAILKNKRSLKIEAIIVIILGLLFSFLGFYPKSPI